jgi:predicted nucleic acid-binding protein
VEAARYVDINTFIYWLGDHPSFGETAFRWIKRIENSPRGEYVTSSLTIYEVIVIIAGLTGRSLKDNQFIEKLVNSITSLKGLIIEPLKPEDFIQGVRLMKEYNLDYEDSLHLAVAIRKNIKEIISNDIDFDKTMLRRNF